ncbi:MAG: exo-alpha-sialidase [Actinobacteria bacterium]|nr:exo-alpha-sialidase [Actinomycetota bacterium]
MMVRGRRATGSVDAPASRKSHGKGQPKPCTGKKPPPPWYQRYTRLPWAAGFAVLAIVLIVLRSGQSDAPAPGATVSKPVVGGDLHSLVVDPSDPDTLYIGSHQGVSLSTDGGETWEVVETLNGADAMGWAFTDDATLVGGHPGISVSTDGGKSFEQRNEGLPSTDVHALGAGEEVIYAGVAGMGTFASTDEGRSWGMRSVGVGGAFMGRILVDPSEDEHLIVTDMLDGAVESTDGGRTWKALGGVQDAMWVSWDEKNINHIIVSAQGSAAVSTDGGNSWEPLEIPQGASIVEFSPRDPQLLYSALLEAPEASVYVSSDGGNTWTRP